MRVKLTPREYEIAKMAASGLSNSQIASSAFITKATVEKHLEHCYKKLGIRGRYQLPFVFIYNPPQYGRSSKYAEGYKWLNATEARLTPSDVQQRLGCSYNLARLFVSRQRE